MLLITGPTGNVGQELVEVLLARPPWISLAPTAAQAWWLSGGALEGGGFAVEHPVWDLWEADLTDIEHTPGRPDYPEIRVPGDIPSDRLTWIGSRVFGVDAA